MVLAWSTSPSRHSCHKATTVLEYTAIGAERWGVDGAHGIVFMCRRGSFEQHLPSKRSA
jgi:hypothetical protein